MAGLFEDLPRDPGLILDTTGISAQVGRNIEGAAWPEVYPRSFDLEQFQREDATRAKRVINSIATVFMHLRKDPTIDPELVSGTRYMQEISPHLARLQLRDGQVEFDNMDHEGDI